MDHLAKVEQACGEHRRARAELAKAEARRDKAIRAAHGRGKLSVRQIASVSGMSHQRVGQIVQRDD